MTDWMEVEVEIFLVARGATIYRVINAYCLSKPIKGDSSV
jgi:hypothetical protein